MSKLNLLTNVFQFQSSAGKATSCSTCNFCWISSFISKSVIRGIRHEKVKLQSTCLWAAESVTPWNYQNCNGTHTHTINNKTSLLTHFHYELHLKNHSQIFTRQKEMVFYKPKILCFFFFPLTVESTLSRKCKLPLLCLVSLILHFLACVWNDEQQLTET